MLGVHWDLEFNFFHQEAFGYYLESFFIHFWLWILNIEFQQKKYWSIQDGKLFISSQPLLCISPKFNHIIYFWDRDVESILFVKKPVVDNCAACNRLVIRAKCRILQAMSKKKSIVGFLYTWMLIFLRWCLVSSFEI